MNRTNIETKFNAMLEKAKELGLEVLTKEDVFLDDDHLDSVWYGGFIGGFKYKGYTVEISVIGDAYLTGEINGREFLYRNRYNDGAMAVNADSSLRETFSSDAELYAALQENKIWYENGNWIEVTAVDEDGYPFGEYAVDSTDSVLDACCSQLEELVEWLEG